MNSKTSIKFEDEDEMEYKHDISVKEELFSPSEENLLKTELVEIPCSFDPGLYVDHQVKEEMVIGPTEFLTQNIVTSNASSISKTTYPCTVCSKTFKYKIGLNKHKRTEHNNNTTVISHFFHQSKKLMNKRSSKYKCIRNGKSEYDAITCGVCFKHFSTVATLRNHMKTCPMLRQKSSKNYQSKKIYDSLTNLEEETVKFKKEKPYDDGEKEEKYNSNINEKGNCAKNNAKKKTDENSDKTCPVCSKTFTLKNNLIRHMNLHSENKMYSCDKCNTSFHRKDYLVKHQTLKHSQSISLKESQIRKLLACKCGKKFYDKWRLNKHLDYFCKLKPLNKEKTFYCDLCGKGFSHKYVLKEHLQRHSNKKTLICDFCKEIFPQKYLLIRHILHHMSVPKVMYECEICDKKFIRSWSLKKHLISHSGKKPFACKYCGRGFRSRWGCLSHEKRFCEEQDD